MEEPALKPDVHEQLAALETKIDMHLGEYLLHRQEYIERQETQELAYINTMKAINELTVATKGVVDAWTIANGFQKFVKWLSGFSVLGAVIAWCVINLKTGP